jgi:hypothetical protein
MEGYLGVYASDRQHLIGFILFLSFYYAQSSSACTDFVAPAMTQSR